MTREQVAAALLAALFGLVAYEYRRYRFWAHWSKPLVVLAIAAIALLNGLTGYLAALAAHASDWFPGGHSAWLANAAIFAGLGEAVPRALLRGTGSGDVQGPSTAIGFVLGWLEAALDTVARDAIRKYATSQLTDSQRIAGASLIIYSEVQPDPSMSDGAKAKIVANLNQMAADLKGVGGNQEIARGQINGFLVQEFMTRFLKRFET